VRALEEPPSALNNTKSMPHSRCVIISYKTMSYEEVLAKIPIILCAYKNSRVKVNSILYKEISETLWISSIKEGLEGW
jgi:hypothetical protein